MKEKRHMKRIKNIIYSALAMFAFGCFALLPRAQGQFNEGDISNGNTVEGFEALFNRNTGGFNTAIGWASLWNNTDAFYSTGVGAGTLFNNNGADNTAVGTAAMFSNTTGFDNTAVGTNALRGDVNVFNTGSSNNAIGSAALFSNQSGFGNQAMGVAALGSNTTGFSNVAIGDSAMLFNTDGTFNTALGLDAGSNLILGNENIYIGDHAGTVDNQGVSLGDEDGVIRIGSFFSGTVACFINGIANNGPFADTVTIDPATGQLGGLPSSARFKKDIEPMGESSEAIYSLKPVTFHYKKDKTNTAWFGLIAEDVAKVNPALIGVDKEGKPFCVAYDKVNAMLLNEFLKAHRKMGEQDAMIARQQKQIDALTAGLQKVGAQLEVSRPVPQTVVNNR